MAKKTVIGKSAPGKKTTQMTAAQLKDPRGFPKGMKLPAGVTQPKKKAPKAKTIVKDPRGFPFK